jgi:hypothetical protein
MKRFSLPFICFILLLSAFISSCQKDSDVKDPDKISLSADSTKKLNISSSGNYLAVRGTLQIKVEDSTYTFDAAQDSIAFVDMVVDGDQYYGLTAINKAHTISFGISSLGAPVAKGNVAGCQFLINANDKTGTQYTLSPNVVPKDFGTISLEKFNQDTVLAKGTFHTYLAKDLKSDTPFQITDGSFNLFAK